MILGIIAGSVTAWLIGFFTGAYIAGRGYSKKLKELEGNLEEIDKQLGTHVNAAKQVNKLKEKVDAGKQSNRRV